MQEAAAAHAALLAAPPPKPQAGKKGAFILQQSLPSRVILVALCVGDPLRCLAFYAGDAPFPRISPPSRLQLLRLLHRRLPTRRFHRQDFRSTGMVCRCRPRPS